MSRLALVVFAVVAFFGALLAAQASAYAESAGETIGRGCTLDPFTHTMRCIDFDHCTRDAAGRRVCPVVITSTRKLSAG